MRTNMIDVHQFFNGLVQAISVSNLENLFYDVAYDVAFMIDYLQRAHGQWCR